MRGCAVLAMVPLLVIPAHVGTASDHARTGVLAESRE